eukprot:scaffold47369_cov19-Prasinocladus_malaysianus.AAC.1
MYWRSYSCSNNYPTTIIRFTRTSTGILSDYVPVRYVGTPVLLSVMQVAGVHHTSVHVVCTIVATVPYRTKPRSYATVATTSTKWSDGEYRIPAVSPYEYEYPGWCVVLAVASASRANLILRGFEFRLSTFRTLLKVVATSDYRSE